MKYMTTKEAAQKWKISERRIRQLLQDGRIEGAVKLGNSWNIPAYADKPAALLGFPVNELPSILYTPLVLDWSGTKLSKSLYVKEGAYSDLPSYLINYEYLKNSKGIEALDVIHNITDNWIEKPYLLFRNYSIYYFKKEFEEYEKSNLSEHKTKVYKKD